MPYDYEFHLRIHAPRPTVFEKLLRIEHLSRWFCGWCRIEPKVGGKFQFGGETCLVLPEGRGWETTIDEGETLRRFAFTWPIRGTATRVAYELEDAGEGRSLVKARHTGVPVRESTCGSVQDAWHMVLGNLKSISEGRTDSVRPDHSPVTAPEVRLSALIETTPDHVFEALTVGEHLDHWTNGGVPTGRAHAAPEVGGALSFGWDQGPDRFLAVDPGRGVALRWPRPGGDLRVEVNLEPKASGVALYLRSTGYRPEESLEILHHRGGWSTLLVCLKNFIEGGDAGFANRFADQVHET